MSPEQKKFMKNFQAIISITEDGQVTGKVWDLNMDEEYNNFRIENNNGAFTNKIREEYQTILLDIKKHCFEEIYFFTEQANRITNKILIKYHNEPEFLWDKYPHCGVFRNSQNNKWYGIIMNIDKSKIDNLLSGQVEVLNIKLGEKLVLELLKEKGYYKAYHMNKKYWLSIILDETITDDRIMELVDISYEFSMNKK